MEVTDLQRELIAKILSCVHVSDLVSCSMVSKAFNLAVQDAISFEGGMGPYLKARQTLLPKLAYAGLNHYAKWLVPPSLGAVRYAVLQKCTLCKKPFNGGFAESWGVYAHRKCLREQLVQVPSLLQYASAEEIVNAIPAAKHLGRPDACMVVWRKPWPGCMHAQHTFEGCAQYPQWAARKAAADLAKVEQQRRRSERRLVIARKRARLSHKRHEMAQARSDKVDAWLRSMRAPAELHPVYRALVQPFLVLAVAVDLRERCAASKLECFHVMMRNAHEDDKEHVIAAAMDTEYEPGATWRARVEGRVRALKEAAARALMGMMTPSPLLLPPASASSSSSSSSSSSAAVSATGAGPSGDCYGAGAGHQYSSCDNSDEDDWDEDDEQDDGDVDVQD